MPNQNTTQAFNLEAEVKRWSERFSANPEEMADHLHCQVDGLMADGLDPATAFIRATEMLGEPAALRAELEKATAARFSKAQLIRFCAAYLSLTLLLATVGIVMSFSGTPYVEYMLAGVYLLSMPMLYLTARGRAAMQAECRMVKKLYRKLTS